MVRKLQQPWFWLALFALSVLGVLARHSPADLAKRYGRVQVGMTVEEAALALESAKQTGRHVDEDGILAYSEGKVKVRIVCRGGKVVSKQISPTGFEVLKKIERFFMTGQFIAEILCRPWILLIVIVSSAMIALFVRLKRTRRDEREGMA